MVRLERVTGQGHFDRVARVTLLRVVRVVLVVSLMIYIYVIRKYVLYMVKTM